MKIKLFALVIISFMLFVFQTLAQESKNALPEGMENITVGQTNIVVPKGMKVVKKEGLIILENISEYVSRQTSQMYSEIEKLKSDYTALYKEVEALKVVLKIKKILD
ncbi:MAG: hypothetical protein ABIG46_06295 [Candidatus Omnitrophota bacterium]